MQIQNQIDHDMCTLNTRLAMAIVGVLVWMTARASRQQVQAVVENI